MSRINIVRLNDSMRTEFSVREVAELLGLKIEMVRQLIKTKKLVAYQKSNYWYVKDSDLMNFISQMRL